MVGDLQTLTNVDAYSHISDEVVGENHPITVFQKMSRYKKTIEKRSALDILVDKLRTEFKPGYVLKNCRITDDESNSNIRKFTYVFNNEEIELPGFCPNVKIGQNVTMIYTGDNKYNKPQFKIKIEWTETEIETIRNWQRERKILTGKIVYIGKSNVRIQIAGITGILPLFFQ